VSPCAAPDVQDPLSPHRFKEPQEKIIFKISNEPVLRALIPVVVFPGYLEVENITHGCVPSPSLQGRRGFG
jgi:hypothetical protein